jgi:hypothetical protein
MGPSCVCFCFENERVSSSATFPYVERRVMYQSTKGRRKDLCMQQFLGEWVTTLTNQSTEAYDQISYPTFIFWEETQQVDG